jgi:DNA-binding response OmpR family regulator
VKKDIWRRPGGASTVVAVNALLVAEHENDTRAFLGRHLERDGFQVLEAREAGEALDLAERAKPDLVLLGSALRDLPGVELCTRLREGEPGRSWNRDVPVILLGDARGDPVDCVRAFARGADDYITPPLVYDELLGRIRAVLRRANGHDRDRLEADELVVDKRTRDVRVGGRRVSLATKEYELLVKLASEPARVFTKEQLLREVWGFRSLGRTRTLDSHASRLRRKLDAVGDRPWVINVWGVGYRLMAPD